MSDKQMNNIENGNETKQHLLSLPNQKIKTKTITKNQKQ